MIYDYRSVLHSIKDGIREFRITAGIQQGFTLGPFLWNIMYDGLHNMELSRGSHYHDCEASIDRVNRDFS